MRIVSTLTNAAYIIAGISIPIEFGAYLIALGILSAIHHWYLYSNIRDITVVADYLGMYGVGFALIMLSFPSWIAAILAAFTVLVFRDNRIVLAVLISAALFVILIHSGILEFMIVTSILSTAYVFNFLGDNIHPDDHDLIHGAWHILSATAILLSYLFLSDSLVL